MLNRSERGVTGVFKQTLRIVFSLLTLCIQGGLFYLAFFTLAKYQVIYYIAIGLSVLVSLRIVSQNANSSYKISWIILVLMLPFGGVVFYLTYGKGRSLPRRKFKKVDEYIAKQLPSHESILDLKEIDKRFYKMASVLDSTSHLPIYQHNNVIFLEDGKKMYEAMREDLLRAKRTIFLEYFIINDGKMWNEMKGILIEKALDGVEIKIIYDSIGSRGGLVKKSLECFMSFPNIMMASFNPLGVNLSLSVNYRDHRKLTIIDGEICYCGGINISDEYIHEKTRFGYWRDNGIRVSGSAVKSNLLMFSEIWYMSTKTMLQIEDYYGNYPLDSNKGYIYPFWDGPSIKENPGYSLFRSMIENAQSYIYISTPYFIIDNEFRNSLIRALQSGVEVVLLIPHIPDKKTVFLMTKYHIGDIIKSGGKVYEYTPGFNHAKSIICDDCYAFCGTFNIDYRSLFLHFECGYFLINDEAILDMKKDYLNAISESKEITYEGWKKRSLRIKMIEILLGLMAPLM